MMKRNGPPPKFTPEQSCTIRAQYESGLSRDKLAALHGCGWKAICKAIRRAGGQMKPKWCPVRFTPEQDKEIRRLYEEERLTSETIGKQFGVFSPTILAAVVRAGGKSRTRGESRRKHSCDRFQRIFKRYHLTEPAYWALWEKQGGKCWWCSRALPKSKSCVIDHKGDAVRGLCCPDNRCNMVSGALETGFGILPANIQEFLRKAA